MNDTKLGLIYFTYLIMYVSLTCNFPPRSLDKYFRFYFLNGHHCEDLFKQQQKKQCLIRDVHFNVIGWCCSNSLFAKSQGFEISVRFFKKEKRTYNSRKRQPVPKCFKIIMWKNYWHENDGMYVFGEIICRIKCSIPLLWFTMIPL